MPGPLSLDLRMRALAAYDRGEQSMKEVAVTFGVGVASLNRWLRRRRETGSAAALPHAGGPKAWVRGERLEVLRAVVESGPDATLPELAELFASRSGLRVSKATIVRALRALGYTRKKRRWLPPREAPPESKRYARCFARGQRPWTLVISSSSTRRARTSG